jgi:hypothetical protein
MALENALAEIAMGQALNTIMIIIQANIDT